MPARARPHPALLGHAWRAGVFLLVDQALICAGIERLLDRRRRFRVVGRARSPADALEGLRSTSAELILCAVYLHAEPAQHWLAPLKLALPKSRVLLMEEADKRALSHRALASGADGVIPTSAEPAELMLALDSILRGYPYLSPALANGSRASLRIATPSPMQRGS